MEQKKRAKPHSSKNTVRRGISFILSFLLSMVFFCIFLLLGGYVGVFNESVILNNLNKSSYYASIQETIERNAESIILPTGLDVSVLEGVISLDRVYIGAKTNIEGALAGKEVKADTVELENQLTKNIKEFAKANKIKIGGEQEAGIATICGAVSEEYSRMLEFPFVNYFVKYKAVYVKVMKIAIPILLTAAFVIMLLLIWMYQWKHQPVRFIAYSLLSSAIMISVVPILMLASKAYQKINVSPEYFYDFMVRYMEWDITVFVYIGALCLVLFALLLVLVRILKERAL